MSEKALRSRVVRALRPLHAVAVENGVCPGTPDVNYAEGWLELKKISRAPSRGGTLKVPHFTEQQRIWLSKRAAVGTVLLLLQIGREYLLLDGHDAAELLGRSTLQELESVSLERWTGWPGDQSLLEHVRSRR